MGKDQTRQKKTKFNLKMMMTGKTDDFGESKKSYMVQEKMRGEVQRKERGVKNLELLELYTSSI